MRLFVLGGGGQLGSALVRVAGQRGDPVTVGYLGRPVPGVDSVPADKTRPDMVREALRLARPQVVIDAGALHNVDYCEAHPDEASRVNAEGSRVVADAAATVGARTVFISTDFVFGDGGRIPREETDPPEPLGAYARSKLDGERAVLATDAANLVVRPSVIYSWTPRAARSASGSGKSVNFGTWLIEEVTAGRRVRIVTDQRASPTLASDLADAVFALIDRAPGGVYHAAGASPASRFEFATALVRGLGLDAGLVDPVETAQLGQKARRPRDSSLSSAKLARETGYRMADLGHQVEQFARSYRADVPVDPR
jgi:dTDP-4-dehydrorhamnose reductase